MSDKLIGTWQAMRSVHTFGFLKTKHILVERVKSRVWDSIRMRVYLTACGRYVWIIQKKAAETKIPKCKRCEWLAENEKL